jgi:hypothetical protein
MDFVCGNETHVQKWRYFLHTLDARVFFQPKDWQASLVLIVHSLLHRHFAHKILVIKIFFAFFQCWGSGSGRIGIFLLIHFDQM